MVSASSPFQLAGILVRTRPTDFVVVAAGLKELPGVDVHQQEPATGRLVATLETATVEEQHAGIERIRALDGVVSAELTYHYVAPPDVEHDRDTKPASGDSE